MKKILIFLSLFIIISSHGFSQNYKIKTIVIDPGHGGSKPGSVGKISKEKDVCLQIGLRLGKMFEENMPDVKIIFTRKTDIDVDLGRRAEIANNAKADLFISIHANSMPVGSKPVRGTETIVAGTGRLNEQDAALRENADMKLESNYQEKYKDFTSANPESNIMLSLLKNTYREKSIQLAKFIQENYTNVNKRIDRGVKEQNILVLQRCGMPAVLTEVGFINNPEEELYINSETGQLEIVTAIFNAVKSYRTEIEK